MKKIAPALAGLVLALLVGAPPAWAAFDDLGKSFDAFYKTPLDTTNAVSVENLTLQKDAMTLVLKKGILVPIQPIEGEVMGAIFVGQGTASLAPPTPMDAWFLKKYYGAETFSESFTSLYMRFDDGTEKIFPKAAPGTAEVVVASQLETITRTYKDRQDMADGWLESEFDMDMDFLDTRIGGVKGHDYFYAQLQTEKRGWVTFLLNYGDVIELALGHDRTIGAYKEFLPWARFHKKDDYLKDDKQQVRYVIAPAADSKEILDVLRTDMNVSIPTTKSVDVDAKLTVTPLVDSLGSLRFDLVNQFGNVSWRDLSRPVTVGSVTDGSGSPLPFIHKRDQLLIKLPRPIRRGEQYVVEVKAKEDTIVQVTAESYVIYNTYPWFLQYGYVGGRYAFDFYVEVQKPLFPVGSGHIVREGEDAAGKMNYVELRMDEPVEFPSILFGRFLRLSGTYASPVSNREINFTVRSFPTITFPDGGSVSIPQGKMKGILEESQNIIKFYETLYGPFPFGDLHVAQMYPGSGFGQAPPGLIQLDGFAFVSQAELESDFLHEFLSHEIAHQYWGHDVGWANDMDAWLSESFAEYSAALYVQALMGEKRFQQKMADWKKETRQGDPVAPVALAGIISGDNAGKYRTQLLYNKGPMVVHMIRMQMGNDNFLKAMKNILTKYRSQNISTEILSKELGLVSGYNWDYFFDQWIRGVGIPEVHTKWKVTPQGGKYLFEMTVNQKDAANFKKILAFPVFWKGSSKEQTAQKDFPLARQGQVLQALLPFEPKDVEVDPNHNLLADIVMDK